MTVNTSATSVSPAFDGTTIAFPLTGLQYIDGGDLAVAFVTAGGVETVKVLGDDYTLTGDGRAAAGILNVALAKQTGFVSAKVRRATALKQDVAFVAGAAAPAVAQERQQDRVVFALQEQKATELDLAGRAMQVPPGETIAVLPAAASRADTILGFDGTGARVLKTIAAWLAGVALNVTYADGATLPTRGAIKAITSTTIGQRVGLSETGREGTFQLRSGNYAALVTADTDEGIYLPHATLATSAAAWVRVVPSFFYLASWWGVGTAFGTTSNLPLQRALDQVPAGSTIYIPNEAVTISGVVVLRQVNLRLFGSGPNSEIIHNAAASPFTMVQLARDGCEAAWFTLTHKPSNLNAGNAVALIVSHNASGFVGTASIYRNKVHDLRIRNSSLPFAIFGNVNGTNFAPVVAAEVWNLDVETNVMGMEIFGAFDSEIRSVRVTYFESVTVNNGSNTLTPALRLLGNERVNIHHCEFDGLAAAQLGHDGFRFSVGNSSGANSGRCRNKDVVIENCRFANFYWISQIEECLGDCIIRNNTFVDDTASTRAGSPGFACYVTGNTTLGKVEKVGHLIIEGNTIEGYSHCLSYYGKIGQVTFKNNRWRSNSATSDGQNVLCVYSQFGGVPLVDIIDNQFVAPENALLKIATSTTTEVVRVFGNTVSEATGDANIQTPLSSPTGLINSSGTGVFKANQNWQYPKGTWAARIAYGDLT